MKREEVKRVISRAIIVVIIAVMSLNLFACKQKTNNVTSANQIKVDVNSPEVQATLGKVRNMKLRNYFHQELQKEKNKYGLKETTNGQNHRRRIRYIQKRLIMKFGSVLMYIMEKNIGFKVLTKIKILEQFLIKQVMI